MEPMAAQKDILTGVIDLISKKLIEAEKTLTELDSMGDADCGSGIRRGFEAVLGARDEIKGLDVSDMLKKVGFTLAYTIGGTSGAMLGTGFIETAKSIGDNKNPQPADWIKALNSALSVIKRRGGNTQVKDKTLVDALEPAVATMQALQETGQATMLQLLEGAYAAAKEGSDRTIDMIARKGRASYVGERSKGSRDPGSLVIVLMFEAALEIYRRSN
jgi:dihydroxyacetone kinase, phosphoprotein-dependent, L subunit